MDITIEKIRPSDAAEMLAYLKTVGGETDNLTFGAEGLPLSLEEEAAYLAGFENSKDGIMLAAKCGGRIIGNANLNRLPRRMSHRGELGISVVKEHWNKGVGGLLLSGIIDFARANDFEIIDLQVRCDNLAAIHLYEKHGFEKLFTYPNFSKIGGSYADVDYMKLVL